MKQVEGVKKLAKSNIGYILLLIAIVAAFIVNKEHPKNPKGKQSKNSGEHHEGQ